MLRAPLDERRSHRDRCPGAEDIAAYVGGGLDATQAAALDVHVASCTPCRRLLSALARAAESESPAMGDSASPTLPIERDAGIELPHGARFGRYVVLDWLGAGGMGVVYAAYDPELRRKVALKLLGDDAASGGERSPMHDALLSEAQAMAQLAHPNVVTVFDAGCIDDRVFIAMELVEGMTLAAWRAAERRTPDEVLAMFVAAGQGLAAAHDAGLIHRDFKPDNVLIGADGRARVTDFGLARPAGAPRTGIAGTLAYMAPEQYRGDPADARADQFSFAVALHEALYGERPRSGAVPAGAVPTAARRALSRALSHDADERYPSMRALLAVLAPRPRRSRRLAVAAALTVAAVIASAGAYAIQLRGAAAGRTELVGRLRGLAPELRTLLRSAHMLPLHDIRPALEQVHRAMREVERQRQTAAGRDEAALIDLVLGEGYQALGDHDRALDALQAAWTAGERGRPIDAALGRALGAVYEIRFDHAEQTVPSAHRDAEIRELARRYRDPAMDHLRAAVAAGASSPGYLEALISFHAHRFADAARTAHAAFEEAPTFYEAGVLEARARSAVGHELLATGKTAEANAAFASARQIFERVLEIARSDDGAWLDYADLVFAQANALSDGDLQSELRTQVVTALHNVRRINPDGWQAWAREAEIHEKEANYAIIASRDPGPHVDQVLALAREARARGAEVDHVEVVACLAQWELGVYQGAHGVDPHPAFEQAITACRRAAAVHADPDKHASLGVVYLSLATYDGEHGRDPTQSFELGERSFRAALAIDDSALTHYSLGRLWTKRARHQLHHGQSPGHAVDGALTEYGTAIRMDATRRDAWAGTAEAIAVLAASQRAAREDPRATLARAHEAIARATAADASFAPALRARIAISEVEAAAALERSSDPAPAVARTRADAQLLLKNQPSDALALRAWCLAELAAARWALAHGRVVDDLLARAASAAARARAADPLDAAAWTASAEVDQLRAAARARASNPAGAMTSARGFVARALEIDPRLARARALRDELAQ